MLNGGNDGIPGIGTAPRVLCGDGDGGRVRAVAGAQGEQEALDVTARNWVSGRMDTAGRDDARATPVLPVRVDREAVAATPTVAEAGVPRPPEDHNIRTANSPDGIAGGGDRDLAAAIQFWAAHYGVSAAELEGIAWCESTFGQDPAAYAPGALHEGAFQFEHQTWLGTPPGQRGESAYNDWYAAEGAAYYLSIGERWRWPRC